MSQHQDYYEVMQISRNADTETIHRVYRFLATRFHPDNRGTGDSDRFILLRQAYEVLSDPARRALYDGTNPAAEAEPLPVFESEDFVVGREQEVNRRMGVLSLLYHRRRKNDALPGLSLLDMEKLMAIPREYLEFTLWYLRSKMLVCLEGNSDISITASGVDYLESLASENSMARELLWPRLQAPGPQFCPARSAA